MFILLSQLVAISHAAPPSEPIRADWLQLAGGFSIVGGQAAALTWTNDSPVDQWFSVQVLQSPEGREDPAYSCTLTWTNPAPTPVDTSAWSRLWPGAAFRIDTSGTPEVSGSCENLDPDRFGADPVATLSGTRWYFGIGPLLNSVALGCSSGNSNATAYVWMEGAAPFPAGDLQVYALDEDGHVTSRGLRGAATAKALPDGFFQSHCGFYSPA